MLGSDITLVFRLIMGVVISKGDSTMGKSSQKKDKDVIPRAMPVMAYQVVPGQKVYGRQAVRWVDYQEAWDTRPEPLRRSDRPKPLNRGKYIRLDGSEYQIDAVGQVVG